MSDILTDDPFEGVDFVRADQVTVTCQFCGAKTPNINIHACAKCRQHLPRETPLKKTCRHCKAKFEILTQGWHEQIYCSVDCDVAAATERITASWSNRTLWEPKR